MMVFWDQRLVVLATPKTGSTALETALESRASLISRRPPEVKHTTAARYQWLVRPFLEKSTKEKFTVVAMMRDPIDWLGSWYRFRRRDSTPPPKNSTIGISFDTFIEGYMITPRPGYCDVGSQMRFLYNEDKLAVDRIFDYADMPAFVGFLEEKLRVKIALATENTSPPMALELDPAIEARLRVECAEDFKLYAKVRRGKL